MLVAWGYANCLEGFFCFVLYNKEIFWGKKLKCSEEIHKYEGIHGRIHKRNLSVQPVKREEKVVTIVIKRLCFWTLKDAYPIDLQWALSIFQLLESFDLFLTLLKDKMLIYWRNDAWPLKECNTPLDGPPSLTDGMFESQALYVSYPYNCWE